MRVPILSFAAVVVFASSPIAAQDGAATPGGRPEVIEFLFRCRDIAEPTARLDCFDRAAAEIARAEELKDVLFADRAQVREARRGLFGFSLPKIRLFGESDDEDVPVEEIEEIETTLASAAVAGTGKWLFVLADGARWLQTDNTPVLGRPEPGDPITIKKGVMGGYLAKVGSRRGVRVERIN